MTDNNKIVDELFAAGAHFGYSKSKRNPSVNDFIFGTKEKIDLINLDKTAEKIVEAKELLKGIFAKNGKVILVANKMNVKDLAPELAVCDNVAFVNNRWIGGTITNFNEVKKRILKLKRLIGESERGEFAKYTKKEILQKEKEIEKLRKYYFGLINLLDKPKAIIVVDSEDEKIAVDEANKYGIDVISISNTDSNIKNIKYPIVANDRSRKTIEAILKELLSECK